jgi:lantibiotic modifying enzyme
VRSQLPFEPIFDPFISRARQQLSRVAGRAYEFVSVEGHREFERSLLRLLTDLAAEALELKFSLFRYRYPVQLNGSQHYAAFLNEMKRGGFDELAREYLALGPLLSTACRQWVDSTAEFLHRLQKDWNEKVVHVLPSPIATTEDEPSLRWYSSPARRLFTNRDR